MNTGSMDHACMCNFDLKLYNSIEFPHIPQTNSIFVLSSTVHHYDKQ